MRWFFIKTQQNEMTLMVSKKFLLVMPQNVGRTYSSLSGMWTMAGRCWICINMSLVKWGTAPEKKHTSIILLVIVHFITTHAHTQPFNGLLSGTTRVGRYQKKHSPTYFGRYPNFLKTQCHRSSNTKNWLDLFSCFDRTLIDLWRTDRET